MSEIAFFGGSFNPVHVAHLILAERVRVERSLDTVLFVPAGKPPHKPDRPIAPDHHRVRMLQMALEGNPGFEISTMELDGDEPCYTLKSVRRMKAELGGQDRLYLLLGGDSVRDLPNWWEAGELVQEVPVIAVERPGEPIGEARETLVASFGREWYDEVQRRKVEAPLLEISATEVRRRVKAGKSVRYMVPEPVRRYILANGLYRTGPA